MRGGSINSYHNGRLRKSQITVCYVTICDKSTPLASFATAQINVFFRGLTTWKQKSLRIKSQIWRHFLAGSTFTKPSPSPLQPNWPLYPAPGCNFNITSIPDTNDINDHDTVSPAAQNSAFDVVTAPVSFQNTPLPVENTPAPAQDRSLSGSPSPLSTPAILDCVVLPSRTPTLTPNHVTRRARIAQGAQNALQALPPKAPISKRKKVKSNRGRNGFSQGEMDNLIELLQEHLPLCKDEWDMDSRLHETRYPCQRRNSDSLRRKCSPLCRTTVPTRDPSIPPVLKAKAIREELMERADIGDSGESDDG